MMKYSINNIVTNKKGNIIECNLFKGDKQIAHVYVGNKTLQHKILWKSHEDEIQFQRWVAKQPKITVNFGNFTIKQQQDLNFWLLNQFEKDNLKIQQDFLLVS